MRREPALAIACLLASAQCVVAALPDTGQQLCFTNNAIDDVPAAQLDSVSRDNGTHPRQDCRYGRDPAVDMGRLSKTGRGARGLDYTKISNQGLVVPSTTPLDPRPTGWACTRDNTTGLYWEVKIPDEATHTRYWLHRYSWYSTDAATNGGDAGYTGGNSCGATLNPCNTQAYLAAVNAAGLCGFTDWRLPTPRELTSLVLLEGTTFGFVDEGFIGLGLEESYWTATSVPVDPAQAYVVSFGLATFTSSLDKGTSTNSYVRVVRGPPF